MHLLHLGANLKTVVSEITALAFATVQEQPFPLPHAQRKCIKTDILRSVFHTMKGFKKNEMSLWNP